jgi:hypothetical protein
MVLPKPQLLLLLLQHWQHLLLQRTSTKSFLCRFQSLDLRQAQGDTPPTLPWPRRPVRPLLFHRRKIHMHPPHLLQLYQPMCRLSLPCNRQSVWTHMLFHHR